MNDKIKRRSIRSFVKREGRLTPGQARALAVLWPRYGLDYSPELIDFNALFKNDHPVICEIGFGNGTSFCEMAAADRQHNYFGIEVHRPGVGQALLTIEKNALEHVRVMQHDAVEIFQHNIPDGSLDKVHVFFPDPWHKKRHHKRRLLQPEFVALIRRKLKANGILHVATDWENYAEHVLEVVTPELGFLRCENDAVYQQQVRLRPKTKFEQRGERLGHTICDLVFVSCAHKDTF